MKILRWIIFSVIITLLPITVRALSMPSECYDALLKCITPQGELLIIALMLWAASAGELFGSGSSFRKLKLISGGASLIIGFFAALYFGQNFSLSLTVSNPITDPVAYASAVIYVSAVFSSGFCIAISEH